jgi:hypothetical protein
MVRLWLPAKVQSFAGPIQEVTADKEDGDWSRLTSSTIRYVATVRFTANLRSQEGRI